MKINIEGKIMDVPREVYAKAKQKQMVEFGYAGLTIEETNKQIDAVLQGKKFGKGLTIIGKFMEDEIVIPNS